MMPRIFPGEPGPADRIGGVVLFMSVIYGVLIDFGDATWWAASISAWAFILGDLARRVWCYYRAA